jgi:hypothetical protein
MTLVVELFVGDNVRDSTKMDFTKTGRVNHKSTPNVST